MHDVVTHGRQRRHSRRRQSPKVEIRGEHRAGRRHGTGEPFGNAPTTRASFPTRPPPGHPDGGQILDRARVEQLAERIESALGSRIRVVEQVIGVARIGSHATTHPQRTHSRRSRVRSPGAAITTTTNTLKHPGAGLACGRPGTRFSPTARQAGSSGLGRRDSQSEAPAFQRLRARSGRRRGSNRRPRFHATRGLSAAIRPALKLARTQGPASAPPDVRRALACPTRSRQDRRAPVGRLGECGCRSSSWTPAGGLSPR